MNSKSARTSSDLQKTKTGVKKKNNKREKITLLLLLILLVLELELLVVEYIFEKVKIKTLGERKISRLKSDCTLPSERLKKREKKNWFKLIIVILIIIMMGYNSLKRRVMKFNEKIRVFGRNNCRKMKE